MLINDDRKFEWLVALGKGLRDTLLSAAPLALAGLLTALMGAADPTHLAQYGVPAWLLPVFAGAFTGIRNVLRNRYSWPI